MDGQQQFLKPAQHVPFYVKRAITIDTSSHPHLYGYENGMGKPASYSVDLSHSRFSRPRHTDQLSEPYTRAQSRSLRDVFEKAILRGDVTIHSPDDDNGVMRNPSFITTSLPRPDKHKQKSATIGGDNYLHIGKNHHRSTDYFVEDSSESESESGRHNDAYLDDASSTISDELFKSTSEGQVDNQVEEDFHIQPLPQLLDIDSHQAGRSALGGFFKPKYRDYPHNNVHRTSERQHKEAIDCGTSRHSKRGDSLHKVGVNSLHRDESLHRDGALISLHNGRPDSNKDIRKLPRTKFPVTTSHELNSYSVNDDHRESRSGSHSPEMSHNKYLPKKRRLTRPHSPRLSFSRQETGFNDLDDIVPIPDSPQTPRRHPTSLLASQTSGEGRLTAQGTPLEQMEVEDPPWLKAEIREMRRRRRRKICICISVLGVFILLAGLAVGLAALFGAFSTKTLTTSDGPYNNVGANSTTTAEATVTVVTTAPPTIPTTQNISLGFTGSLRITSEEYIPDFDDLNSPQSVELSQRFCGTMDNVFHANSTDDYSYQGCNVTKFSNGSVIIDFWLDFSPEGSINSTVCEGEVCSPKPPDDNLTVTFVKNILLDRFESASQGEDGGFVIDWNSTHIEKQQVGDKVKTTSAKPLQTTQLSTLPPPIDCRSVGKRDAGQYRDPVNCMQYFTCYDGETTQIKYKYIQQECTSATMYEQTDTHSGTCVRCNNSQCESCEETNLLELGDDEDILGREVTPEVTDDIINQSTPMSRTPITTVTANNTTTAATTSTAILLTTASLRSSVSTTTPTIQPVSITSADLAIHPTSILPPQPTSAISTTSSATTTVASTPTTPTSSTSTPTSTTALPTTRSSTVSVISKASTTGTSASHSSTTSSDTSNHVTFPTRNATRLPSLPTQESHAVSTSQPKALSTTMQTIIATTSTQPVITSPATRLPSTTDSTTAAATTTTTPQTSVAPTTHSGLCGDARKDTLVSDPNNCAKIVFCYSNSTYVEVECPCEQMFVEEQNSCAPCNNSYCGSCKPCKRS